ncbi:MAG: trypsin-like peptidase domain-containing protein, partial [Saprospiraceae bacterium]|nr:trypsin-like peptidase domain-containing protein [Saprospiraceae bacterium]
SDNMVSRHHATIKALNDGTFRYQVIDENSTNGILVNGQKIKGMAVLVPGDQIQLGNNGPEFKFDLSPRPDVLLSETRVMAAQATKATEINTITEVPTANNSTKTGNLFHSKATQVMTAVAAGVFLAIILFSNISWTGDNATKPDSLTATKDTIATIIERPAGPSTMTTTEIANAYKEAVVYINNSWKLENVQGKQMYHRYTLVEVGDEQYVYPCYIRTDDGTYEPYIEPFDYQGYSQPVGGQGSGSGFVVSEDGFIMTNKHVSAPWNAPYHFPEGSFPGLEVNQYGQLMVSMDTTYVTVNQGQVGTWIAGEAYIGTLPDGKLFEGKMIYQDVIFANRTGRHPARVARVSDSHDVALLKVDAGAKLTTLKMFDNYNEISSGTAVTIMGYPALTPMGEKYETGNDFYSRTKVRVVPNLSINQGIISAVHKGSTSFNSLTQKRSLFGDAYQLSINSAGHGNSGGPLFDEYGRVIGIYYAGQSDYENTVSFAVPIKYAMELLEL